MAAQGSLMEHVESMQGLTEQYEQRGAASGGSAAQLRAAVWRSFIGAKWSKV